MEGSKFTTPTTAQSYDAVYEKDPRHVAVDAYTTSHLLPTTRKYHRALEEVYYASLAAGLPDIACTPSQAKLLMLHVQMSKAKYVLEIGTLGGYSAAWMATARPDIKVTTIEIDSNYASTARANVDKAGLGDRIEILIGPALEILPSLAKDIECDRRLQYDFVFIDANKQDNLAYFEFALTLTSSQAVIVVDNVVRNGKVASADEAEKDGRVLGTRQLIEAVGKLSSVEATIIQTVDEKNYDGFMLAVKQ